MKPIANLLNRVWAWHEDHEAPIDASLDACLPPPEITWALFALVRYHDRVQFAEHLFRTEVQPALNRRAGHAVDMGGVYQRGIVPGAPDWVYELQGSASSIKNQVTGEQIDLDILNGPEFIQLGAFAEHSFSFKNPGPIERRLRQLFPRECALDVSVEALSDLGLIQSDTQLEDFEICDYVLPAADAIIAFLGAWRSSQDLSRLAAVIGDWSVCRDAALATDDSGLVTRSATLAEAARQRWLTIIRYQIGKECNRAQLTALLDAGADDARVHVVAALADRDTASAALYALGNDPVWCPDVFAFFETSPVESGCLYAVLSASKYLLRHDYRRAEVIAGLKLKVVGRPGAVLELVIDYAPDEIADFLEMALHSPDHHSRLTAVAILAVLGSLEARRVLGNTLWRTDDHDFSLECRTALRHSRDPAAIASVVAWEASHRIRAGSTSSPATVRYEGFDGCESALPQIMQSLKIRVERSRQSLEAAVALWCQKSTSLRPAHRPATGAEPPQVLVQGDDHV